jgi:hypothetical protein
MANKLQDPRCSGEAKHSGIQPVEKCMSVMCLRVVKADGPLQVLQGRIQLPEKEQRISFRQVSFHQKPGVLHALGQAHELLCQVKCRLQLCPYEMKGS